MMMIITNTTQQGLHSLNSIAQNAREREENTKEINNYSKYTCKG